MKASLIASLTDLAQAAYVHFGQVSSGGMSVTSLTAKLAEAEYKEQWSSSRRDDFASTWRVVAHQTNTDSGFSGTVFERLNPAAGESRFVVALRGTEGLTSDDLWQADIADLVANGLAREQIIDMYNCWQELITPIGGKYQRTTASVLANTDENRRRPDVIVESDRVLQVVRQEQVQTGVPVADLRAASVDVTGHSLGGHLATGFSRLFPSTTHQVVSINGAGYGLRGGVFGAAGNVGNQGRAESPSRGVPLWIRPTLFKYVRTHHFGLAGTEVSARRTA